MKNFKTNYVQVEKFHNKNLINKKIVVIFRKCLYFPIKKEQDQIHLLLMLIIDLLFLENR